MSGVVSVTHEIGGVKLQMQHNGSGVLTLDVIGRNHLRLRGLWGTWKHWNFMESSEFDKIEASLRPENLSVQAPVHIPVAHNFGRILEHCGLRGKSEDAREKREQIFGRFLEVVESYRFWAEAQMAKGKSHRGSVPTPELSGGL